MRREWHIWEKILAIENCREAVRREALTKRSKRSGFSEVLRDDLDEAAWKRTLEATFADLYAKARELRGQVSGEHGIGFAKRPYLDESLAEPVRALMRGIKSVFDPQGILNPHKVVE